MEDKRSEMIRYNLQRQSACIRFQFISKIYVNQRESRQVEESTIAFNALLEQIGVNSEIGVGYSCQQVYSQNHGPVSLLYPKLHGVSDPLGKNQNYQQNYLLAWKSNFSN